MRKTVQSKLKQCGNIRLFKWGDSSLIATTEPKPVKSITKPNFDIITNLKTLASMNGFCSLSANQIFQKVCIFVCLKKPLLVAQKWDSYENLTPSDYEAIVNPNVKEATTYEQYAYEECPSIPQYKFKVRRPIEALIEWADEEMVVRQKWIDKFQLRVWLHQITHMEGRMIIDPEICKGEIELKDEYKDIATEAQLEILKIQYRYLEDPKSYEAMSDKATLEQINRRPRKMPPSSESIKKSLGAGRSR